MKLNKIALRNSSQISQIILNWATQKNIPTEDFSSKSDDLDLLQDGLIILNQNQETDRDVQEIRNAFDRKLKPVHNIDINGTLAASVSNLELWIERNRCKNVLIIGSDSLMSNPNLERFISGLR
jgi:hypothetical protein